MFAVDQQNVAGSEGIAQRRQIVWAQRLAALSLLLQQLLWLDPRSYDTLIPPAVGLVLGAVSPGALATRPSTPASS